MSKQTFRIKIERRPSLREVVYSRLKDAILAGVFPKKSSIYEARLAREMNISRTPVREALHALEREMLITSIDKVGYEINDIDMDDLEEISEIRKTVETLAVRRAMDNVDPNGIRKLESNLARSEKVLKSNRPDTFVSLDAEFHNLLCSMSGRNRLVKMAGELRKEMHRFRSHAESFQALAESSLGYHKEIVRCMKKGDYPGAKKSLIAHIEHVKKAISNGEGGAPSP